LQIIVNADDLGIGTDVNDAVFALMAKGKITSATILANGPALADALLQIPNFPQCSFGVHLNLTQFTAMTADSNPGLKSILNTDGTFRGNIREVSISRDLRRAIYVEWSAQIETLRSAGVKLSHIDSHHHVHTIPALFTVLKRIQKRFGIRKVRISMNLYPAGHRAPRSLLLKKALWNLALAYFYRTITTAGFGSSVVLKDLVNSGRPRCKSIELMTHPGNTVSASEVSALNDGWLNNLNFPFQLVSYDKL
jgi:chitin disaccharide deacetylase